MLSTPSPMVLSIRGSGKISIDMATVFKCGQTVLDTKAIGDTTRLAERESFGMLMVFFAFAGQYGFLTQEFSLN